MFEFKDMELGILDVFLTVGTFFVGIFMSLIERFNNGEECNDTFCSVYGVALSVTTLTWLFVVTAAFMYRIHYTEINRIVVVTTHILMRLAILLTIISINLTMWYKYPEQVGKVAGLTKAIFANVFTFIMLVIYCIDFYQYKRKELKGPSVL